MQGPAAIQEAMRNLERIVHPLVRQHRAEFLKDEADATLIVLDIPLLYETGGEREVDAVAVVSCASEVQRQRVLSRPDMTEEKFQAILAKQTPDEEKRQRAKYVIDTGCTMQETEARVQELIHELQSQHGGRLRPGQLPD